MKSIFTVFCKFALTTFMSQVMAQGAWANLIKSPDLNHSCTIYQIRDEKLALRADQEVVSERSVYGIFLSDLEVDFVNRVAKVNAIGAVALWFNINLTSSKLTISSQNPDFTFLVNQLNRKLVLLEKICVNPRNELVYVKHFGSPHENR